jgi:hypothetical protein
MLLASALALMVSAQPVLAQQQGAPPQRSPPRLSRGAGKDDRRFDLRRLSRSQSANRRFA